MSEAEKDILLNRAKRYSSIKYSLAIINLIYLSVLILLFLGFGLSKVLVKQLSALITFDYLIFPAYLFIVFIIYYLLAFPLDFYHSFIIERKFCLSKQKISDWLKDELKSGLVFYALALILFETFYFILKSYPNTWWLTVSLFWIFFNLILAKIAPVIIIPLFFKYIRLTDGILRERIINLAKKMRVKILDVFEINFSKKTFKANAAFVGWGATRRIILADTLKDKYSYDEIEVILAHEFAHYKLRHLLKLILVNSFATVLAFYMVFKTSNYVLSLFDLPSLSDIASFPVVVIYLIIFGTVMQPFENHISRRLERSADSTALTVTGSKGAFISMMEKLSRQNLADRNPHPLIKIFFFDHPPINERIKMAESF